MKGDDQKCPYCQQELKGNAYAAHFKNNQECKAQKQAERANKELSDDDVWANHKLECNLTAM